VNSNGRDPEHALAACGLQRDPDRPASYTLRSTRLGVSYAVAGTFVAAGDGLLQLEMVAPMAKRDFVRDLYTAWVRSVKGE
jgi:hypothetical protein